MPNLLNILKTQVDLAKSLASAGWEYVRQSINEVIARERHEISDSRATRMAGIQEKIEEEICRIKDMFHISANSAAAGADSDGGVADARQVYEGERDERGRKRVFQPIKNETKNRYVGMCYFGGGIHSATFNLGVTSGLAKKGYLKQVDYFSTVSGGGYIGSWLSAWAKRAQAVRNGPGGPINSFGINEVEQVLAQNSFAAGDRYLEPDPVRFLRKYSNYLAPRTGLLNTDLWALITVYLRSVMLKVALLIASGALALEQHLFFSLRRRCTLGRTARGWCGRYSFNSECCY